MPHLVVRQLDSQSVLRTSLHADEIAHLGQIGQQPVGLHGGVFHVFGGGLQGELLGGVEGRSHAERFRDRQIVADARADVEHLPRFQPSLLKRSIARRNNVREGFLIPSRYENVCNEELNRLSGETTDPCARNARISWVIVNGCASANNA